MRSRLLIGLPALAAMALGLTTLSPQEELGKNLFFDTNLSSPPGQSCASCHGPAAGWTGPDSNINDSTAVYPGAVHSRYGGRKPPTSAYASYSPPFYYDEEEDMYVGGQFWDGRAADLVEQAKGPFFNPLEQNNPNLKNLVNKVAKSSYAWMFEAVYGPDSLNVNKDAEGILQRIAEAIALYEASAESNQFTSKFDYYVEGLVELTPLEAWGLELFNDPSKGNCAACHPSTPGPYADKALFTDYTYDNLGLPKNPQNPFYTMPKSINPLGWRWVDYGLEDTTGRIEDRGKFKVPTLRNIDKRPTGDFVKAYGHNGFFKTLKGIVRFYNTRDVLAWPAPEVAMNVNDSELGNLGLTNAEEDAIVAFLKTLSDGYVVPD